ncbi:MAG: phage protein Gp27 family protein [Pseudomonadota bacterium]
MPPPRKIDLLPDEFRVRLARELQARGFADIIEVTDQLNFWLEEQGLQLTIGKSAVGEFSKVLKDQRDAFKMAEVLLEDMDVEAEGDMHKMLMHMIATQAAQYIASVSKQGVHLEPKDLMNLGRMLKDLMQSSGLREKFLEEDRARIAKAAREEAAEAGAKTARDAGLSAELEEQIKANILGVAS